MPGLRPCSVPSSSRANFLRWFDPRLHHYCRTRASNGNTSPVDSSKSAALNSTQYSAGRFVSSGLNARTNTRPVFRQKPVFLRIFSAEFTVTRIALPSGAMMCSPAYSGSERRPSGTAPLSTCPQVLRPENSTRSNDSLSIRNAETFAAGRTSPAPSMAGSCARSTQGSIANMPTAKIVFPKNALRSIFLHSECAICNAVTYAVLLEAIERGTDTFPVRCANHRGERLVAAAHLGVFFRSGRTFLEGHDSRLTPLLEQRLAVLAQVPAVTHSWIGNAFAQHPCH